MRKIVNNNLLLIIASAFLIIYAIVEMLNNISTLFYGYSVLTFGPIVIPNGDVLLNLIKFISIIGSALFLIVNLRANKMSGVFMVMVVVVELTLTLSAIFDTLMMGTLDYYSEKFNVFKLFSATLITLNLLPQERIKLPTALNLWFLPALLFAIPMVVSVCSVIINGVSSVAIGGLVCNAFYMIGLALLGHALKNQIGKVQENGESPKQENKI